jgi:hypothetical protein
LQRARRRWRCLAAVVAGRSNAQHGAISAWLHDHAYRDDRGTKGADQLARLVAEMTAAGITPHEQDAALLDLLQGVRRDVTTWPLFPAA